MSARRRHCRGTPHAQRGFAIMAAVFLLVVLSLLGAMIVALSSTQQVGQARDLLGTRAYYAARAGIELGVFQALRNSTCTASTTVPLLGFTVAIACSSNAFDEGGSSVVVYSIVSTATQGTPGALDYAERQVRAVVSTP